MQRKVMSILGTLFLGTIYLLTLCIILLVRSLCCYERNCCWFKVVEVVDFYILLPRAMLAKRDCCLRCRQYNNSSCSLRCSVNSYIVPLFLYCGERGIR